MDALHVNPHNSIHDGPKLYCDECHFEHKKSENMCLSCHSNDVKGDLDEWLHHDQKNISHHKKQYFANGISRCFGRVTQFMDSL